jgi:glycosyltransferase involved in cell wall biosynthesis
VAIADQPMSTGGEAQADPLAGARVGVIGISIDEPCGVRDHAGLLADALAAEGISCSLHWLSRSDGSIGAARAEARKWVEMVTDELERDRPDAILLHYSVFAFSHRGVPVFSGPLLAALRRLRLPLVSFMHEYAYPWRLGGLRGKVWAVTQRAALVNVVRASATVVVSGDTRADWLRGRVWLPHRPTLVAPVFSNLPSATDRSPAPGEVRLGLFGYGHEGVAATTVLDALRLLHDRGSELELVLLGAPGRASAAGARWAGAAARRGIPGALSFSGRLPAQELSNALAGCDVLLFAENGGPTSRKTTLAASLASGRPVVALDGPNSWPELLRAEATLLVEPDARSLAKALTSLLEDRGARERQGQRGRAFAEREMSLAHSAGIVAGALGRAISEAAR